MQFGSKHVTIWLKKRVKLVFKKGLRQKEDSKLRTVKMTMFDVATNSSKDNQSKKVSFGNIFLHDKESASRN